MFKKLRPDKIALSIIVVMGGLILLKKVSENNIENFEEKKVKHKFTKKQIELNALKKILNLGTVKELAKKLKIKKKIDKNNKVDVFLEIIKKYETLNIDIKTLKEQKTQLQLEEITKKDKKDIKDYNESLKEYLEYQKSQNKKIDLLQVGNDIDNGMKNVLQHLNKVLTTKKKEKKKSKFEGFQITSEEEIDEEVEEEFNNINLDELKNVLNSIQNKEGNTIKEDYADKKKEKELDDSIVDLVKYIFDSIFKVTLGNIDKIFKTNYILTTNNIFKLFDNKKLFDNDQTLIGGGVLFIIISFGLYFMDLSF
jgi:hypothetical protein